MDQRLWCLFFSAPLPMATHGTDTQRQKEWVNEKERDCDRHNNSNKVFIGKESTQDLFEHKGNVPKCSIIINLALKIFTVFCDVGTRKSLNCFRGRSKTLIIGSAHWCRCFCLLFVMKEIEFHNFFFLI